MATIGDDSIDLVVTSPPYPMIEMWDDVFGEQDPRVRTYLDEEDGEAALQAMHQVLDGVWRECVRTVRPGGFVCINIGDATRKIGDNFRLYTNHVRITQACEAMGLQSLPPILWRKQTNGPNKFMGSGMLPSGAYVTLEHEYILIFRKGNKRSFGPDERARRRKSAIFWEERNQWFSDLWDLKGVRQELGTDAARTVAGTAAGAAGRPAAGMVSPTKAPTAARTRAPTGPPTAAPTAARTRSAAFPFELAFRLIHMYSLQGDTVLDPFVGTGTTLAAAMASARNSIGIEIDESFSQTIDAVVGGLVPSIRERQIKRYHDHLGFARRYQESKGTALGYENGPHQVPVMTRQETDLELLIPDGLERIGACHYLVRYDVFAGESDVTPFAVVGFDSVYNGVSQLSLPLEG